MCAHRLVAETIAHHRGRVRYMLRDLLVDDPDGHGLDWFYPHPSRSGAYVDAIKPCHYCGDPATTIDHKVPRIRGGSDDEHNLVPACRPCNSSKGTRTYIDFLRSPYGDDLQDCRWDADGEELRIPRWRAA